MVGVAPKDARLLGNHVTSNNVTHKILNPHLTSTSFGLPGKVFL